MSENVAKYNIGQMLRNLLIIYLLNKLMIYHIIKHLHNTACNDGVPFVCPTTHRQENKLLFA